MRTVPIKQREDLFPYIPQRPPFVMVDKLFEKGENYALSGFLIEANNVLVENGQLKEGGLVENIAQTAALFAGLRYAEQGKTMPVGFIAGIKDLVIEKLPKTGSEIQTRIIVTHDLNSIQVVEGVVLDEHEQKLASCELKIFLKEE